MTLYNQFIKDVQENPDNHNEFVKLSVNRHLTDLEKENYDYYFDTEKADRAIKIIKTKTILYLIKKSFIGYIIV